MCGSANVPLDEAAIFTTGEQNVLVKPKEICKWTENKKKVMKKLIINITGELLISIYYMYLKPHPPVTSSECSKNDAYCIKGLRMSHNATELSNKWEQLEWEGQGYEGYHSNGNGCGTLRTKPGNVVFMVGSPSCVSHREECVHYVHLSWLVHRLDIEYL